MSILAETREEEKDDDDDYSLDTHRELAYCHNFKFSVALYIVH